MTSHALTRTLKPAVAAVVSAALFVTSVATPAAAQIRAGAASEAGVSGLSGAAAGRVIDDIPSLPTALVGSASLSPALTGSNAPTFSVMTAASVSAAKTVSNLLPTALAPTSSIPAAAKEQKPDDEAKITAAKPVAKDSDGGPRWVGGTEKGGVRKTADAGPRWVSPIKKFLSLFAPAKDGRETFDGSETRTNDVEGSAVAEKGQDGSARSGLKKSTTRTEIIQDIKIPTPEAVSRTRALDAKPSFGPRWVKPLAPLAVLGLAAWLTPASIVPAAIVTGALMFSILAHETAHILGLRLWGDKTPKLAGRDSLNPLKHISMVGTVLVPAASLAISMATIGFPVLFGWAKPVPVDFNNLRNPKTDAAKVAILGPAMNMALAAAAGALYLAFPAAGAVSAILLTLFKMNAALTVFNLLPLPQLDGGKVLVSLLPKSWYARWTHDPNLPNGYQKLYKRIYEGPANLLSKLHVHSFEHVNTLTRVASLAALGLFYAAFYTVLSVPLLFLALPCSYDYWCIREKVRSEAAVQDLMGIMSQWAGVIVQIADDLNLNSEVSAYETEHAMKNALEDLVDKLMKQPDFRSLDDNAKLEEFMKQYPDYAAGYLKDKAMTEDSLEDIKRVLADPRNGPFYDRLRKWFGEHEIFSRWNNEHHKEKLKDALKEAEKGKASGALEGPGALWMSRLLAFGRGVPSRQGPIRPSALALPKGAASVSDGDDRRTPIPSLPKLQTWDGLSAGTISVDIDPETSVEDVALIFEGLDFVPTALGEGYYRVSVANRAEGWAVAQRLARQERVVRVVVNPILSDAADDASGFFMAKVQAQPNASERSYTVRLSAESTQADLERIFAGVEYSNVAPGTASNMYRVTIGGAHPELAARRIAKDDAVLAMFVHPDFRAAMVLPSATPVVPTAVRRPEWVEKIKINNGYPERRVMVQYDSVPRAREAYRTLSFPHKEMKGSKGFLFIVPAGTDVAEVARDFAGTDGVASVTVGKATFRTLTGAVNTTNPQTSLPLEESAPSDETIPPVAQTETPVQEESLPPPPPPKPTLPENMKSHGKAEWGPRAILVKFKAGADAAAILAKHGDETSYAHGDMKTVSGETLEKTKEKALALAAEEGVEEVKVHPNVAAMITEDEAPYPDAQDYDHVRSILVDFRTKLDEAALKAWADERRLRLVYPDFRGSQTLALFEVPAGTHVRTTMQFLVNETAYPDSQASTVSRFQEQPGESPLVPAPSIVAEIEAAKKAAEAPVETRPARRDPATAWIEFLQNVTLADGKTKLKDDQIELIAAYLKPIAKSPDQFKQPVVARTEEIKRALPIISSPRGMRNSVILVGEAGVGKTAIAEGLAEMAEEAEYAAQVGESSHLEFARLKGRWFVEMDINAVLASDEPVKLLNALLKFLPLLNEKDPAAGNRVIVLMDEIQKFFLDRDGQKIANLLKNPLRNGEISVIAGTTRKEYKEYIEKDDAFRRRLEKIDVEEFTVEKTIRVLRALSGWFKRLHKADIPDQALVDAAKLTDQFDKTNFNPDKAIKAVQDAAELSRPENLRGAVSLDIRETWTELAYAVNLARQELADKGIASTIALPAEHFNAIAALVEKAAALYRERDAIKDGEGQVTTEVVKRVIAQKTGISSGQLNLGEEDASRYNQMEEEVARRVVNQLPAIHAIANAIRRNKAGLSNPNRPMGKFLMVGPTGVGKTYIAKELARFLFNDPNAMTRFDMSEFMAQHSVARLTGSPPGYVGYGEGGQLTEAVRKKPYSVLLFDEVEKAHPDVFNVLLQVLDDGRLTDGEGRTVDFKNTVILMTSNAGMKGVNGEKYAELLAKIQDHNERVELEKTWDDEIRLMVGEALKQGFKPEFLNRLDEDPDSKNKWIVMNRLRAQDMLKIAQIQLGEFKALLADRHDTELVVGKDVEEFMAVEGFSPLYGARPMTAAIEKHVIDPLAKWILDEAAQGRKEARGGRISLSMKDGKVSFKAEAKPPKQVQRVTIAGAAESMAAQVFDMIEKLAQGEDAEQPTESVFDAMLRRALPKGGETEQAPKKAERPFFSAGAGLSIKSDAVALEHNNSKRKDAKLKQAIADVRAAAAEKGWGTEVLDVLDAPAGSVGEGWLKQVARFMKDQAAWAALETPVSVTSKVEKTFLQVAFDGAFELDDDAKRALESHFTGAPPASYQAAQNKADKINISGRILLDHNLLDLYRRVSAIPGARMGYTTSEGRTRLWLEIETPKPEKPAEKEPETVASSEDLLGGSGTPHQRREMEKVRGLLMSVVDQNRLKAQDRDGHALRLAAADGWAMLAQPSDLAVVKGWLEEKGWAKADEKPADLADEWPLAVVIAQVFEKYGAPADIPQLEAMARRVQGTGHYNVPVHGAVESALAVLYARAGLAETRAAAIRGSQIGGGHSGDIKAAVKRALGSVGMPVDVDEAKGDPEGYLALMKRMGKTADLQEIWKDTGAWGKNSTDSVRQAALMLARETGTAADLDRLKNMILSESYYSATGFEKARAWAHVSAREGLTAGVGAAISAYLAKRKGMSGNAETWGVLLAYVELARLSGGAADLAGLEEILDQPPGSMNSLNEQAYFTSPDAWAQALVRSGKFEEYARPQGLDAEGRPKPSKLMEMLASKDKPMKAAAALRAIAYARDPRFKRGTPKAKGDVKAIPVGEASSSSYGGYHGW